jgi:hypothetical protein
MRKDLLLVYIHGFLGSEDSFCEFPQDLPQALHSLSDLPVQTIDSVTYPTYDTKGHNERAVMALVDWLLLNATTLSYRNVVSVRFDLNALFLETLCELFCPNPIQILLAHSMGGLLAVDAYRYLYKQELLDLSPTSPKDTSQSILGRFLSHSSPSNPQDTEHSARHLVNIVGILSFDSPFYGLDQRIYTQSSLRNVQNAVKSIPAPNIDHVRQLIPKHVEVPVGVKDWKVPVSTEWIAQSASQVLEKSNTGSATLKETTPETTQVQVHEAQQDHVSVQQESTTTTTTTEIRGSTEKVQETRTSSSWQYVKYAATGVAAAAAVAYLPLSVSLLPMASTWMISKAEEVRHHMEFLYPLATSLKEMQERVLAIGKASDSKHVVFRGFYLEVMSTSWEINFF